MRLTAALLAIILASCASGSPSQFPTESKAYNAKPKQSFNAFYQNLRAEIQAEGLPPELLDKAFGNNPQPIAAVLESEQKQPEFTRTFSQYVGSMVSEQRLSEGRALYHQHRKALKRVEAETSVPASVIVALWGAETHYGKVTGGHPVIPALATLAWSSPRAQYFRTETIAAIRIADQLNFPPSELTGSWAGALGQCQFMPTNYLKRARDGNDDGIIDIWHTQADVFASAGNFLGYLGWQQGQPWKVRAPAKLEMDDIKLNDRGLSEPMATGAWNARGAHNLPFAADDELRYYKPEADQPAYLLGPNFDVIMRWNKSSYFAWSVLTLADNIAQKGH